MYPLYLLQTEVRAFLFLLAAVIAYKLLTRRIALTGFLSQKDVDGKTISPERIQLLLATIAMSSKYLGETIKAGNGPVLPDVNPDWLYMFGGSSGIYMLGKVVRTLQKK